MPLEPRGHAEAAAQCRVLAVRLPWSEAVLTEWPTPIATEYWRLRHELGHGRTMDALVQFKDLAELLVKLPVLLAARVLMDHGSEAEQAQARRFLLATQPPTLGTWCGEGLKLARQAVRLADAAPWRGPLSMAVDGSGRASELWNCLGQVVIPWRNEELAHGALKLDLAEFTVALEPVLSRVLGCIDVVSDAWRHLAISAGELDGPFLSGSAALDDPEPWLRILGGSTWMPLRLRTVGEGSGAHVDFGPYLCLRRSDDPPGVSCYLLNKRIKTPRPGIHLIDYQHSRTTAILRTEAGPRFDADLDAVQDSLPPGGDLADPPVRAFLDAVSIHNEYIEPDYLRHWLSEFIAAPERDRGLAWLSGPGDVGKTLFSYGLATMGSTAQVLGRDQPEPLLPGLDAVVVPLRKEYRCTPPSLSSEVQRAIDKIAGDRFLGLEGSLRDPRWSGDTPGAFCAWLDTVRSICGCDPRAGQRLLVVLDGLDELPPPDEGAEGGGIADLLPPADRLPPGVFLLVTSRPGGATTAMRDRCPAFVFGKLQSAWQASPPSLRTSYALDPLANGDYRRVLEQFFRRRAQAELVKQRVDPQWAFEQTLLAAEHRFKGLSHFASLLGGGGVTVGDLAALSTQPLKHHLEALERHEPRKRFGLIRAILLELAAAEEAHMAEVKASEPSPVVDPQWLGLDILELARRVGFPCEHARALEPRFLSALYSVGELLRSYRGEASGSSLFALGLKGMLEQLQGLVGWETGPLQWREMRDAFLDLDAAQDDDAGLAALLRAVGPTLALADRGWRGVWSREDAERIGDALTRRAYAVAQDRLDLASAIRLCGLGIAVWRLAALDHPDATGAERLASMYGLRGSFRLDGGQLSEAVQAYSLAIDSLPALEDADGRPANGMDHRALAGFLVNRANAVCSLGSLRDACADYDRAIRIMESLLARSGPSAPADLRNDLAAACANRGIAYRAAGDIRSAIADYDRAIGLREALRHEFQSRWPSAYQSDLATTYANRGNARGDIHDAAGAAEDLGQAVDLLERLHAGMQMPPPPNQRNELAGAYVNRAIACGVMGDLLRSGRDLDRAIAIRESLRDSFGDRWPAAFCHELALAYANRANVRKGIRAFTEGERDAATAVGLLQGLRTRMGKGWPSEFGDDLARALVVQATVLAEAGESTEAIEVFGHAIALLQEPRTEADLPQTPARAGDLMAALINRGNCHLAIGDIGNAVADYSSVIEQCGPWRVRFGDRWSASLQYRLAVAHINRGNAHGEAQAFDEAVEDYRLAIVGFGSLGDEPAVLPFVFRQTLATALRNRSAVLARMDDAEGSMRGAIAAQALEVSGPEQGSPGA